MQNDKSKVLERYFPFWNRLSPEQCQRLCMNTVIGKYKKGSNVHGGDGSCTGAIIVMKGSLRAYLLSENGREVTLYRFKKEEVCMLSASCVIPAINFDVVIDAEEDSELLIICGNAYAETAKENIYAENFALDTAVKLFSDVVWVMQQIMFMSLDKRIAVFLWGEIQKTNSNTVYITHEQLAKYINSAREAVTRMLKYFASEGIVELFRGGIRILDTNKLEKLAV